MNSIKNKRTRRETTQTTRKGPRTQKVAQSRTNKGVPPPPPPPPPPPSVPGVVPKDVPKVVDNNTTPTPETASGPSSLEKELADKMKKLKQVDRSPQPAANDKMIQGSGKNFLQNALSTAIRNRRNNLHMHDDENDDDDEDDWDD